MQHMQFTNGGYVLHKIRGNWSGTVSAWFDHDGALLDAEQILRPFGSSRRVMRDGQMWQEIALIGKRYKNIPVA